MIVLKRPIRSLKIALDYAIPKRLTLKDIPPVYAWLWWNFTLCLILCLLMVGCYSQAPDIIIKVHKNGTYKCTMYKNDNNYTTFDSIKFGNSVEINQMDRFSYPLHLTITVDEDK